jgi:uncharacterized membrane protein HdeD (DUF308 family)
MDVESDRYRQKILRTLGLLLGIFFVVSGCMLLSPIFTGVKSIINGIAFLAFAYFLVRYAVTGRQLGGAQD